MLGKRESGRRGRWGTACKAVGVTKTEKRPRQERKEKDIDKKWGGKAKAEYESRSPGRGDERRETETMLGNKEMRYREIRESRTKVCKK